MRWASSARSALLAASTPHIDPEDVRAAQPLHFALVEEAQQLGLHAQRQLAYLVEKQCAAMSAVNAPDARLHRAGESAAHIAE